MKKIVCITLLGILSLTSCIDLDVPPKGLITDDNLLTNEDGLSIYLSRLYSEMPIEDFKYMGEWGFEYNSWLGAFGISGTGEAVNRDGMTRAFTSERTPYWGNAFKLLRETNYLIENLPSYKENFPEKDFNNYMGQAYFMRAFVFYAMAKRFGGIPLVTDVIDYPAKKSELEVPRSSEEETWNQILKDFDTADSLLSPVSLQKGTV